MNKTNRRARACVLTALFCLLTLAALPASAAVLTTDQATYTRGETVHVTFLNDGDGEIFTTTSPALAIMHLETEEWVLSFGMLPEVITLQPGEFLSFSYDTGATETDPAGLYRAFVQYVEDYYPISTATADYLLQEPVAATVTTLDRVKCLYRFEPTVQ